MTEKTVTLTISVSDLEILAQAAWDHALDMEIQAFSEKSDKIQKIVEALVDGHLPEFVSPDKT